MKKDIIPCKNCISFAMCNSKISEVKKATSTDLIDVVKEIHTNCSLIHKYINKYKSSILLNNSKIKLDLSPIVSFFLKEDRRFKVERYCIKLVATRHPKCKNHLIYYFKLTECL